MTIRTASSPQSRAFSLVELLVVVGIMGLLFTAAKPAFESMGASRNVEQGMNDVSGLLEFARSEAVARQTYVWVGFANVTDAQGRSELRMAAVYSKDGSPNPAAANQFPFTRLLRVQNVALKDWDALRAGTRELLPDASPVSVAENPASASISVGGSALTRSLTFTPRGEALLLGQPTPYTPYAPQIDVSIRQTRGNAEIPDADDAAVIIDGGTGSLRKLRI